jgi:carbon monoxide dehydrogenase subunit G
MLHKILKGVAPVFALALAAGIAGCDGHISVNGKEGVPLSELDLEGKTPTSVVLAGPDNVVVTHGDKLAITVAGDAEAADALRFTLDDETLGVMRKSGWKGSGKATVRVTLPELRHVTLAGSGTLEADRMTGDAEATVAGSGSARIAGIEADKLEVTIAGSGALEAAGTAGSLELTVAGSGTAKMAGLKVDKAKVTIAGSGDASFASDGTVEATVMGSGDVTVTGSAKCTIKSMGSGKLHCSADPDTSAAGPAAPPAPPPPPTDQATPE